MRVFTILGVIFLVLGIGLLFLPMIPGGGSFWDQFRDEGAWIVSITFIPMGLIFTAIGLWFGRLTAGRKRLLRDGVPGQATILSVEGGNVVINNIHYLVTFQLLVQVPGRQPYQTEHKQLVPIFAIASLPIGSSVPVMVDRTDPHKLTIDLAGEAAAMRQAAAVAGMAQGMTGPVVPNTLSTMRGASPNTFTQDLPAATVGSATVGSATVGSALGWQSSAMSGGQLPTDQAAAIGAVVDQLARAGITIDPQALGRSVATQAQPPADGLPGSAFVRAATDTGIVVQGDAVVELTLDVTAQGGAPYEVRAAALVPAAARSRALPGATVPVRIDPAQPANVVVDWLP